MQLTFHKELYGESVLRPKNSAANCIIESSEVLKLQEESTRAKQLQREADVAAAAAAAAASSKPQQSSLPPAAAADSNSSVSPVGSVVEFHRVHTDPGKPWN